MPTNHLARHRSTESARRRLLPPVLATALLMLAVLLALLGVVIGILGR